MSPARYRLVATALVAALAVGACSPTVVSPTAGPTAIGGTPSPATEAPASDAPATPEPTSGGPTIEPMTPGPTLVPGETPEPTGGDGPAAACSGNDGNRNFFANLAAAVAWPVYCAVLPAGWFVQQGSYRLANGGKLEITYAGPGGARLALSEGAFCTDGSGCVPAGSDLGSAAFGDREGTLVSLSSGGWAIVVDRGETLSWLLVATGVDEIQARALGAALAVVDG